VNLFKLQAGALSNSVGVVNLAGAVLKVSSIFSAGEILNSTGTVFMTSGELIVTNDLTKVGNLGSGQFTQSGGTSRFAFLSVGDNKPGRFDLTGGTLIMQPRNDTDFFRVGNLGNGDFNQSGGTALVMSEFHLADDIASTGTVNITGGQFIATNQIVAIGRYGTGVMTISNATATVTNVSVGRHAGATGTLNILTNGVLNGLECPISEQRRSYADRWGIRHAVQRQPLGRSAGHGRPDHFQRHPAGPLPICGYGGIRH
jgi:hypothetical protein